MNETKQCNNGHFYSEDLEKCPLCSDKDLQNIDIQNKELDNSSEKFSLQEKWNITDNIKLGLDKLKNWIEKNSRAILHISFILGFLFSLSAVISHVFFPSSLDFLFVYISIFFLSSFTVLSFKYCHPYYQHILFVISFLFSLSAIISHVFFSSSLDFLFVYMSILWLSSCTILSFKSCHPYYPHILFVISFLFFLSAIILRIFFSPDFPLLFVFLSIIWLSSFTVLSFKSYHPPYSRILLMSSFFFYLFFIILIVFGLALNQESLSSKLIALSFLVIVQLILYFISGIVLKIKHNPLFFSFLKNKFFYIHFIVASVGTVFLFWLLVPVTESYTRNSEEFELKSFQSFTIKEASTELEELGLKYQLLDSVFTDSVPKGTIFTQNPIPGTLVKEGRLIYFTVNCSSSQKFEIPDVYNKSEREATNQLKSHFEVEIKRGENYSPVFSVVTMIKVGNHEVFPGQELIEGTKIIVYFGSGRGSSRIIVPLLIGSSTEEAKTILEQSNLKIGSIIPEGEILDPLNAIVIDQRPLSESKLQAGGMVDLVIKQFVDSLQSTDSTTIE